MSGKELKVAGEIQSFVMVMQAVFLPRLAGGRLNTERPAMDGLIKTSQVHQREGVLLAFTW